MHFPAAEMQAGPEPTGVHPSAAGDSSDELTEAETEEVLSARSDARDFQRVPRNIAGMQHPLHVPMGAAGDKNVAAAAAAAAATTSPASALQALKTQADRRGLQMRCEDEKVSEQEWRAHFVLTTSAGENIDVPWSSVCLGLKRAKQAAAELALNCLLLLNSTTSMDVSMEGMADVGAEASQRTALGNTAAATATAVYALPVMNAISYRV
jgi:hypothetical protein